MKTPAPIFQTLHHICIVVRDLKKSVAFYESVGVGPWHDYPPLADFTDLKVQSRHAFLTMVYKYANIGNSQIQLCQPGEGESPQRLFLETKGEGVFHVGFTVPDCDAGEVAGEAMGLKVKMKGRRSDRTGFTYFETTEAGAGVTLEIRVAPKG